MNKDGTTGDIDKQRDMMSTWIISTTTCNRSTPFLQSIRVAGTVDGSPACGTGHCRKTGTWRYQSHK